MVRISILGLLVIAAPAMSWSQSDHDYSGPPSSDRVPVEQRVDINRATLEDLLKVPGMTRTWAQRILRFRPYRSKQDLLDEGIVPGAVYNRIRDYLIAHRQPKQ
ncbi:helix-hairpin-helix domain-containing protein [Acidobacteria bacterium AB60]|nr:helix-hairpin-helix domain-containing protein [Acidobacteria bacterium AB60]